MMDQFKTVKFFPFSSHSKKETMSWEMNNVFGKVFSSFFLLCLKMMQGWLAPVVLFEMCGLLYGVA